MSKSRKKILSDDNKRATRQKLLEVARRIFTRKGYAATSVSEICKAARVTHGALYHHFAGKMELFAAVVAAIFEELARKIQDAADSKLGWEQVEAASNAYLDACTEPAVQVILLREAPTILAHATFLDTDAAVNEPLVAGLMHRWIQMGIMLPLPLPESARILGGAFAEAGAILANVKESNSSRESVDYTIARLLNGFRA